MKHNLILLAALILSLTLVSQLDAFAQEERVRIFGRVLDASAGDNLDYADVIVADENGLSIASSIVEDGRFLIENVPVKKVQVLVRIVGYDPYVSGILELKQGEDVDLGTIRLNPWSMTLGEVSVVGEKNQIVYKLDRRIISGTNSVSAGSGTAADILSNTPSVLFDSSGEMTFRGSSNFQVYVDGKLSPLEGTSALRMIPASTVEDIEIITTPSARYRADGDAGIINITTKRSSSGGWSGLFTSTGSTLGTYSLDGTMTYQKGANSVYFGGTFQDIKSRSDFSQQKTTIAEGVSTTSDSNGERWGANGTRILKTGWQYADGNRHNLSLDLQYGRTSNWRGGDMTYDETRLNMGNGNQTHNIYDSYDRYNLMKDLFQLSLGYTWKVNNRGDELVVNSRFRYDWYAMEYTESNMFEQSGSRFEGTRGFEEEHHWDCDGSLAYILKYSSSGQIEVGGQYTTYSEHGGYKIKYWDRADEDFLWVQPQLQPFYYRRQVYSAYAMFTDQFGNLTVEAGVRGDGVHDYMNLPVMAVSRDKKYFDLFPSAHLSYNADKAGIFSAGYSYRTNRPGIWQTEPYITYEDYYTKKVGNPDIVPEYSHSVEAGWRRSFTGGHSISATAYYRNRKDITDWTRSAHEAGVTLDSLVNAGNQIEKGLEISAVAKPTRWWTSNLSASYYHYRFTATSELCTSSSGNYYNVNFSNIVALCKHTKLQLDTRLVGPKILTQGRENSYYYWDLAARRELLGGRLTLSITAHDVFHTAKYVNFRKTGSLESQTFVRPKYANVIASLTYNFNASKSKSTSVSTNIFEGKDF